MLVNYGKEDNIWFKKSCLGKNKIGKLYSKATQNNGTARKNIQPYGLQNFFLKASRLKRTSA